MKSIKKSIFVIFLFSLIVYPFFAQEIPEGTDLCDTVFSHLQKKGFHPQVQTLNSSGTNNFPYNIIVTFTPQATLTDDNFLLIIDLKDAWINRALVVDILNDLKDRQLCSTTLFCYTSNSIIPRDDIIFGAEVFAQSVNSPGSSFAYIINFAQKNEIIAGADKIRSPSWMYKDLFDAYSDAKLTEGLPICYISQVSDFAFSTNNNITAFQNAEINCIYGSIKDANKAPDVITSLADSFIKTKTHQTDSHTFMFRFFGSRIWLSEYRIVNIIIIFMITSFVLLFTVGFINKTLRKEFWHEISSIWYVLPLIYALTVTGFFAGKGLYKLFVSPSNTKYTVFGIIILGISISLIFVSSFYMLNLTLQKKYTTRSLDFVLVIDTFINLVIFTLIDISLFPIFMLIFLVSLISLIFRRNWIHIILYVFLIVPFLPYINTLYTISDSEKLHQMLVSSNRLPLVMSLTLLPVYLMNLRILNAVKKRYAKKRIYAIVIGTSYVIIFTFLLIINRVVYSGRKNSSEAMAEIKPQASSQIFELNYSDKSIFSDTIRQIHLSCNIEPVYINIRIDSPQDNSAAANPILYSENDYVQQKAGSAAFRIPLYPPSNLEFTYGAGKGKQTITAEVIYYSLDERCYYSSVKSIITEGNE